MSGPTKQPAFYTARHKPESMEGDGVSTQTTGQPGQQLLQRLERLPMSAVQLRLLLMGGLGYTFDAADGAIIAFILVPVTALFHLTSAATGLLGSSLLIGYLFGALTAGILGDLIGRRRIMMYALAIYAVASLIAAFSPNFGFLFAFRVIAGFGTGAESAIIAPFLSEFIGSRYRGRYIGSLAGFFSFGFVLAAVLGYLIVPAFAEGWRVLQVLTALPILMLLWWRRSLPESPRWLLERGRVAEAEQVVTRLETEVEQRVQGPLPSPDAVDVPPVHAGGGSFSANLRSLWSRPMVRTTSMLWILWFAITFSYYGFFVWIPTLLVNEGFTVTKSFGYSIIIYLAQIPGYYSAAFISERLGRKWTIVTYLVLGAVSAFLLSLSHSASTIVLFGVCLSFFMNGTYAAVYTYTPELLPTSFRTTGMGVASAVGRIGGILAPIIIGFTFASVGFGGVFGVTTVVLAIGALTVAVLGISTTGKTLERIASEELAGTRATGGI